MNYIVWKGIDSRDVDGLLITELPPITKPAMRVEETEIEGRDGSIIENLGYSAYDRTMQIGLHGDFDMDAIIDYFSGSGEIIFSNEEEKVYQAQIIDQIDYERLVRFRTAEIKFRVQPYKHLANEVLYKCSGNPIKVSNTGYATALPLLHIKGSGAVEVFVNDKRVFKYTFDSDGEVYIDAEEQDAYLGNLLKNRNMVGGFPALRSGSNTISYSGDVSLFEIKINTRFL